LLLSIATQGAASDPLPAWLGRYRTALALVQAPTATSGQWSRNFDQALRELDPDPQPLDSAAWQTHQRWQQLLEEFAAAQTLLGNLGARDALRQLRSLAQRTRFAPAAPSAPVLVTAATADPIIHYDGIWVGGLHEAVFPQSSRADPFLPRALQREFGVVANDPDALLQRARRELAAWQRCSGELRLSFAQLDDGTEQAISPLLRSWPIAPPATRPTAARGNASGWLRQQVGDSAALEARDDSTGLAVAEGEALSGGTGLLASYNQCAFRGYAELRLKARGWDEPRSGVDPLERGQIIHSVLQALWSTWRNGAALAALDDAARRRAIEAALHDVLARHPLGQAGALATRAVEREARRALRLVDELCALEAQRPAFAIAALESRRPLRLGPAVLDLQIDRVDALASGAQVVLDYKTGRGVPTDWNGERPDTIQLIAYRAALAPAPVEALCYAQLSESQVGFRGLSADAAALAPALPVPRRTKRTKAWEQRSADWDRHLAWLGARIAAGAAVVEPRASACRYCDLALLCRRAEQAGSPDDDDDGGAAAGVDEAAAEAAGSDA
jgi:probable DNA repair protein